MTLNCGRVKTVAREKVRVLAVAQGGARRDVEWFIAGGSVDVEGSEHSFEMVRPAETRHSVDIRGRESTGEVLGDIFRIRYGYVIRDVDLQYPHC